MIQRDIATAFQLTSAPSGLVVTVEEVKEHLRIDESSENAWLRSQIESATAEVEDYLKRQLLTATWKLHLDEFPDDLIEIRKCPVLAVTAVTYYDADNQSQTLATADYVVDIFAEPARITEAHATSWPATYDRPGAVTVTFTVGYGDRTDVPDPIKTAIKNLVGQRYCNREGADIDVIDGILEGIGRYRWG